MSETIHRSSVPKIGSAAAPAVLPGANTPDAASPAITPLVIAAILALMLHVASGVVLDRSHASQIGAAPDDCVSCQAQTISTQPSLAYD